MHKSPFRYFHDEAELFDYVRDHASTIFGEENDHRGVILKGCTAYGFLDHSLKQDCATIQSHWCVSTNNDGM